jgi:hypothetical protein
MRTQKRKPATSAALDWIAAALVRLSTSAAKRLGLASIAEYIRELHRRNAERAMER